MGFRMVKKILFGVDYYPEHRAREKWSRDAELMASANFNVVRIAEFAWSWLEPEPGRYDFSWLDFVIDMLSKKGIKAIIGTPTASPPPWVVKLYPDILPVDFNGHVMPPTARRHYCPNNPNYLELTKRIVSEIAKHYKDNPNVIGYQIDNELGLGLDYCYCKHCITLFRKWLKEKYGSIENLNKAYGTIFWSHVYRDWDEIYPPTPPFDIRNRSLALDWFRFKSYSFIKYLKLQIDIIKSIDNSKIITTNLPGSLYWEIDNYEMGKYLDVVSWDNYPRFGHFEYDPAAVAMQHDATRCMSKNYRFWVMELQAGPTDGYFNYPIGMTPEPGELRKWAYQAYARGAEAILYFRWDTCPFGKEQYWHGILNHDDELNRRYYEVKQLGEELKKIEGFLSDTHVESDIGIVFSYDSLWATIIEKNYYHTDYRSQILTAYKGFWEKHLIVDVIPPNTDLSRYRVIALPFLYVTNPEVIESIKKYVYNGGVVIASARTSVKDSNNNVYTSGLPGGLQEVFGIKITDYTSLPKEITPKISIGNRQLEAFGWIEELTPTTAEVLGIHRYRWLDGKPAITINRYGKGIAIYIGSFITLNIIRYIVDYLINNNIIRQQFIIESDELIEVINRKGKEYNVLFLINHSSEPKNVKIYSDQEKEYIDILEDTRIVGKEFKALMKAHDVKVVMVRS